MDSKQTRKDETMTAYVYDWDCVKDPEIDIAALDLRAEATEGDLIGTFRRIKEDGFLESVAGEVLFLPEENRAGICEGGNSIWTDAHSIRNALDRYFGLNGWEIRS